MEFRGCPISLLHHFPHRLERGLLSSTGIARLPRYYEPIRLPAAPGLTFAGLWLVSRLRPRDGVSRVAPVLVVCVPSPLPRWSCWVPVALFPSSGSFPCVIARSASTSLFSGPARRLLALQPAHSRSRFHDPFHRRLQTGRYLPACSDCYRLERPLPEGTCTLSRTVPFHGTRLRCAIFLKSAGAATSGLLRGTDILRIGGQVSKVPIGDITAATRQGYQHKDRRRHPLRPPCS